ncbi:erythromycin esterase family protein [Streptomyces sedi]|nr:erythromycin esterase family protein [Streptomyces sedi]
MAHHQVTRVTRVTRIAEATHPLDAAAVQRLLPTPRPRVLALGEPTHGEDALLEMRNTLFRALVETAGYRTIALETDCLRGLLVDDHVTADPAVPADPADPAVPADPADPAVPDARDDSPHADLDDVMERGFSHPDLGLGASPANRALVRWMRAHNARRPAPERLHFAGFDGPLEITAAAGPRQALTALHAYLAPHLPATLLPEDTAATLDALLGDDDRWADPEAMLNPARSIGRSPVAERLRLLADDLTALLDEHTPHLLAATSRDALDRARLHARTATGLLRYHHWMADASPARMTRLVAVRDQMMAANLLALAERGPVLVHAHNSHLQRVRSAMGTWEGTVEWWSAGALVDAQLGDDYAFLATALGSLPHRGVHAPPPDTVEGLLHALPHSPSLTPTPHLTTTLADAPPTPRTSPWFGYAPLDPTHLAGSDAVVYVGDVRRETE